ncbi:MAG: glycosyltransferase family 2 protein [Desulfuromonas sp.]|nr:glycosyltransferase family 2 protein [Desulfuromonas sp.]
MKLTIVVPVFNEEENLPELCRQVFSSLDRHSIPAEVIFVDDGSRDRSFAILQEMAARESRARVIRFARNYGQTAAMAAGFAAARGEVVVPLDADLQNNPDDIPRLLARIDEGYDVVSGWRKSRQDRFLSRRLPSILANHLISVITHVHLHDYGCTLKAYRREVLEKINLYGELHRFVPALAFQVGARVTEIPVDHRPRLAGVSKYGIDRTLRVVLDLVTVKFLLKYATRPLQLFGKWAFGAGLLSGVTFALTLWMKFAEGLSMNRNPLLILSALLLFSAVQFIALGLLGELVTRTYHEVQDKPIYTIRETVNMDV